jgi:hypothetical protein
MYPCLIGASQTRQRTGTTTSFPRLGTIYTVIPATVDPRRFTTLKRSMRTPSSATRDSKDSSRPQRFNTFFFAGKFSASHGGIHCFGVLSFSNTCTCGGAEAYRPGNWIRSICANRQCMRKRTRTPQFTPPSHITVCIGGFTSLSLSFSLSLLLPSVFTDMFLFFT